MTVEINLVNEQIDLAIYQGATYDALRLLYPEDLSAWSPKGQIRTNYLYLGGQLLAEFLFFPLVWQLVNNSAESRLVIRPYLPQASTATLPIPKKTRATGAEFRAGVNCWVYDIELISPDNRIIKIARGYLDVIPEVTSNA